MKTIQYYTKNVYGRQLEYLADTKLAGELLNLTGSKTLLPHHRGAIVSLIHSATGEQVQFEEVVAPKH